ncbi:MAG: hypothetical protein ACM3VW_07515 [Bacteroidota bacterium]
MRILIVLTLGVLLVASLAHAQGEIRVVTPAEGTALGPNYDVIGTAGHRAFLVVMTDVINADTGECIRSVPGIRHWTNQDGTFHFRVASPRVSFGERGTKLTYRVRVAEVTPTGTGTETTVNTSMQQ